MVCFTCCAPVPDKDSVLGWKYRVFNVIAADEGGARLKLACYLARYGIPTQPDVPWIETSSTSPGVDFYELTNGDALRRAWGR